MPRRFATVPFVWSDQYEVKIQCVGRFGGDDRMEVVHGDLAVDRFVTIFERRGRISGVLGFSQPRRVIEYRNPKDLPRRAHVLVCEGDPNRRETRLPGIRRGGCSGAISRSTSRRRCRRRRGHSYGADGSPIQVCASCLAPGPTIKR